MAHSEGDEVQGPRFCSQCGATLADRDVHGVTRLACTRCRHIVFPDPKVAVVALLVEDESVLLVQRRHAPEKGKWVLPGGFLDAGEDPRDVAVREMREETSLEIETTELIDIWAEDAAPGSASLVVLYRATRAAGAIQRPRAADDAADARFFPVNALPDTAFRSTERALSWWRGDRARQKGA